MQKQEIGGIIIFEGGDHYVTGLKTLTAEKKTEHKIHHFSLIFRSMTNRRICGTIEVPENDLDICAHNAFKSILILIFCKQ